MMLCCVACDCYILDENDGHDIVAGLAACPFRHCDRGNTGWDPFAVPVSQSAIGHAVGAAVPETLDNITIGVTHGLATLQRGLQHIATVPADRFGWRVAE
jgi:hypothetical protein